VAVLVRASFITVLDGFCNCTIFQIGRHSCLKVMMDCYFSLLIWAVHAVIWTFTNRAIFWMPPLPCHSTSDWLKHIKKENNSTK
jgi:hypothetical protein